MSLLDYQTPPVRSARVPIPRRHLMLVAGLFVLISGVIWFGLLMLVRVAVIDSHFTRTPQADPAFTLSPWQTVADPRAGPMRTREATLPLMLYTLRYTQVMSDADGFIDTTEFHADIRWIRATILFFILAGAVVPCFLAIAYTLRPKRE